MSRQEISAREWVESVLGGETGASFGESLRDGVALCKIANRIVPGSIDKINLSSRPFKQVFLFVLHQTTVRSGLLYITHTHTLNVFGFLSFSFLSRTVNNCEDGEH